MINLKDKLSHLTFRQACKLLGPNGGQLIRSGGKYDIDIYEQVVLKKDLFQLNLDEASVSIRLDPAKDQSCPSYGSKKTGSGFYNGYRKYTQTHYSITPSFHYSLRAVGPTGRRPIVSEVNLIIRRKKWHLTQKKIRF